MANCSFCGDDVALPYTCSLCNNKFCGKHRLAENHECPNIGVYQTKEYRKQKRHKVRELEKIKSGSIYADDNRNATMTFQSRFLGTQSFWVSSNPTYDLALGGLFLAGSGLISSLLAGVSLTLVMIVFMLLMGVVGFIILGAVRNQVAEQNGVITRFEIWPLGVAITLITSLFPLFRFILFGFFINSSGSPQGEVRTGIYSIGTAFGLWAVGFFVFPLLYPTLPGDVVTGLILGARTFLWYGIIMLFPIWILDGAKIFNYDRQKFWILLAVAIIFFIINVAG